MEIATAEAGNFDEGRWIRLSARYCGGGVIVMRMEPATGDKMAVVAVA